MSKRNALQKVIIPLKESNFAQSFKDGYRIHQLEYEKAIRLVNSQISALDTFKKTEYPNFRRLHNTISIFGGRGSGKTSFLHSVIENYTCEKNEYARVVEVLRIIDPTILEEKGHIFLYIISLINDKVNDTFDKKTCSNDNGTIIYRKKWQLALTKLAKGLPALDSVGPDYHNHSWQDDEFIMEKGLLQVSSALDLEKNFHDLVDLALSIINKKVFLLAFDDVV